MSRCGGAGKSAHRRKLRAMAAIVLTKKKLAKLNAERKRVEAGEISMDDIDLDCAPQTNVHFTPRKKRGHAQGNGCCVVS